MTAFYFILSDLPHLMRMFALGVLCELSAKHVSYDQTQTK